MSWKDTTLAEVCSLITDGKHGDCRNQENSGYYFLSAKDVKDGRLNYANGRQITQDDFAETHRRTDLTAGDILLTNSGTIGRLAIAPEDPKTGRTTFQKSVAVLKPIKQKVSPQFLFYSLAANKNRLVHDAAGAAQKNLLLGSLRRFEIAVPDLPTQERIAAILSAYDDLIENNRRRIALLEQAARLLYREWFVHFRFPGHETAKFVGGLPEGWELKTYGELFNFLGGFAFKSSSYVADGRYGVVTIKNVHDGRFVQECASHVPDIPTKIKPHCRLETGDVLLSLTGNVGRSCIVVGDSYLLNQRVAKIVGRAGVPRSFAYWTFSNQQTVKDLENLAYGVAQLNLSPVNLAARDFVRPADGVLAEFDRLLSPAFDQLINLTKQNAQLTKARDLLLQRLMDGRIPVKV